MGVQTVLLYGAETVYVNKSNFKNLRSVQGNLVKTMLGLRKSSHSSPLFSALNIKDTDSIICLQSANLLRSCLSYESNATHFYSYILHCKDMNTNANTLVHRCFKHFNGRSLNLYQFIIDDVYRTKIANTLKSGVPDGHNGLIDSIRQLCNDYDRNARDLLQGLVSAY